MKPLASLLSFFLFILLLSTSQAQDKLNIKFGKVSPEDFNLKSAVIDSSANAVVVADVGFSEFQGNTKGYFSLRFKRQTRIKILNKNGLEAANVQIPLYVDGTDEEKLESVKAVTYNLENGKVVETKLENSSIFKDKLTKKVSLRKFTLPAAKEGSIIEYSYTVVSDFLFNLQPWEFQGEYPKLWSEYEVRIPEYFQYVFLSQGSQAFFINKPDQTYGNWSVTVGGNSAGRSETFNLNGAININRWVMKDMPALKEEAYTSTLENHIAKVQFQLSAIQFPNSQRHEYMGTWPKVAEQMMKDEDFGQDLSRANNWLDDDMKIITAGAKTELDKAKAIYTYVKNNFTATEHYGLHLTNSLKTVFKTKNGNVADINLLLVAMMHHEKINADPVLLSTKNHGYTHEIYPIMERFNYVICDAQIDGKSYYLDASNNSLDFGQLHWKCYNGHARIINETNPMPVYLDADSISESKMTSVVVINSDNGKWEGSLNSRPGIYETISVKDEVKEKGEEAFFKKIKTGFINDIKLENTHIDSLKKEGLPITIHYDFDLNLNNEEDIIYFNPMMGEVMKDNPFKSAERTYPVEMPCATDETFVANIEIPKGYVVDELPKSARVSFNETDGMFEYLISNSGDYVQLRCRLKLNKANFLPEEYESLRGFFSYVVSKEGEQVVFKKKK